MLHPAQMPDMIACYSRERIKSSAGIHVPMNALEHVHVISQARHIKECKRAVMESYQGDQSALCMTWGHHTLCLGMLYCCHGACNYNPLCYGRLYACHYACLYSLPRCGRLCSYHDACPPKGRRGPATQHGPHTGGMPKLLPLHLQPSLQAYIPKVRFRSRYHAVLPKW